VWKFQGECSAYVETLLPEYWPAPGDCHKLNTTNATPIWICSFDIHFRLLFFFFFIEFVELTAHLHLNACNTFILYHISRLPAVILSYSCDIYKKKKTEISRQTPLLRLKEKKKIGFVN
jgi:hypothetical protein